MSWVLFIFNFKIMNKFLKRIFYSGLVLFIILNIIGFLCLMVLKKSNFYKPEFVENGISQKKIDYVVLGSSTGLTSLDTKSLDSLTHKTGINISMDDSALNSHLLMLEHFYKIGKSTDKLVLAITPWDVQEKHPKLNNNDYRFLPYIYKDYVYDYYKKLEADFFKPLTFSRFLPIIGVSYYNTELFYPSFIAAIKPKKRNRFDDKGNYSYPTSGQPSEIKNKVIKIQFNNPYFKKIEDFCFKKNIKLILYISPIYKTTVLNKTKYKIINHSNLLTEKIYFYDNIHVNQMGRKKCTMNFAKYL